MYIYMNIYTFSTSITSRYGVATISRLLQMIGLFCKRALSKRLYSAKETKTPPIIQIGERQALIHLACYRLAKTHMMPYLYRLFSAKEPYI